MLHKNFNKTQSKDDSDVLEINKFARFNFTEVSNGLKDNNSEIQFLSEAYSLLSQQAHLSEFSREIIYNRHAHMTKLLNVASGKILKALICFINEIDTESTTSKELEAIKELYYSKL